jgi:hypothetical protein
MPSAFLCSSTARKLHAERRAGKVVVQVDIEPAHREHDFLLPGAATCNPQRRHVPRVDSGADTIDGGDDADEAFVDELIDTTANVENVHSTT